MSLAQAGISCSGPSTHSKRAWIFGADRRIRWRGAGRDGHGKTEPVPGPADVIACDAWRGPLVLLADGAWWRYHERDRRWQTLREGDTMQQSDASAAIVAAGAGCGGFWCATRDRRVWAISPAGRTEVGVPVPGEARILAVDASSRAVLLEDGGRLGFIAGNWRALPGINDESAKVRLRVVRGFTHERGDLMPGDTLELDEAEARRLVAAGRAEIIA